MLRIGSRFAGQDANVRALTAVDCGRSHRGPWCAPLLLAAVVGACAVPLADVCSDEQAPCASLLGAQEGQPDAGSRGSRGTCGDGVVDAQEDCDDGSACEDGRSCTSDPYRCGGAGASDPRLGCLPRSGDGCSAECRWEPTAETPAPPGTDAAVDGEGMDASATPPMAHSDASHDPRARGLDDAGVPTPLDAGAASPGSRRDTGCVMGEFQAPQPLSGLPTNRSLWAPALSADGFRLFFAASGEDGEGLLKAARQTETEFNLVELLDVNSSSEDGGPYVSGDSLSLYFHSNRAGGKGDRDLWVATRSFPGGDYESVVPLESVNSASLDHLPWLSTDQLSLVFVSTRLGGLGQSDLWIALRASQQAEFGEPEPLTVFNTGSDEGRLSLSADNLTAVFSSARSGGAGEHDLWIASRQSVQEPFGEITNLSQLNTPARDLDPFLSEDGRQLLFASSRNGGPVRLYRSVRDCE